MRSNPHDPALLAEQVLGRRVSPEALEWLARGFATFDRADGALPLERCLGLPTRAQRRRGNRDYRLIEAAALLPPGSDSVPALAQRLGAELDAFIVGPWRAWRALADPPADAGPLREALFYAVRAMQGRARPSDKRIEQLLRKNS